MNPDDLEKIRQNFPNTYLFENIASLLGDEMKLLNSEIQDFIAKSDQVQNVNLETPLLLFSMDSGFRAYCSKYTSVREIVISKEVIFLLSKLSDTFMRHKKFMPHIGDISKEEDFELQIDVIPRTASEINSDVIKPNCPIRKVYSLFLFKFMIFYIIGHELSHIRRGHLDVNKELDIASKKPDGTIQNISALEIMELDADSVSIDLCLNYLKYISDNLDKTNEASYIFESYENIADLIFMSVKITSIIFNLNKKWINNPLEIHYPPSPARVINLITQIGMTLDVVYNIESDEQYRIVGKLITNFYETFLDVIDENLKNILRVEMETFLSNYQDYIESIPRCRRALNVLLGAKSVYQNLNITTENIPS
jgi:hypothetical protein